MFRSSRSFDVAARPGAYQGEGRPLSRAYDKLHVRSACSTCDIHMSKYGGVCQEVKKEREGGERERDRVGGRGGHTHEKNAR